MSTIEEKDSIRPSFNRRTLLGGIALLSGGAAVTADSSAEDSDNMVSMTREEFHAAFRMAFLIGEMSPRERLRALAVLEGKMQPRSEASA